VPPGAIVEDGKTHEKWFASLDFNLVGEDLPPVTAARCAKELPELSTGLLLFDSFICNPDRHARNLAVNFLATPPTMSVFDHGHALLGDAAGGVERLAGFVGRLGMTGGSVSEGHPHVLLDHLGTSEYFEGWLGRIEGLPDYVVRGACDDVVGLGINTEEAGRIADFLLARRKQLRTIVSDNHQEFRGIRQWGLFA